MIGVFDSGFGGLTVLKELLQIMPQYNYLYLGDQARYPYGPRSPETLRQFAEQNIKFLFQQGAKIILIACNSATTAALSYLQQQYPAEHILGVVVPAAEKAVQLTRFGNIGVVGTTATIKSGVYDQELRQAALKYYRPTAKKAHPEIKIFSNNCPLLVPLIEEGWSKKPETKSILRKYLLPLKNCHIDTIILGCTHYPILKKEFQRKLGKNCAIVNASQEQALSLKKYLENHPEVDQLLTKNHHRLFYTTDCPEKFSTLGSLFLGETIKEGKKVELP
jgi:glutamate racemase